MPGLVPGIHVLLWSSKKTWMAGTSPAMTASSGIKPRLGPRLIRSGAAEFDAVVQAERAVVPEFELGGRNAPTAPAGRARHVADDMFCRDLRDRLLKGKTAFQRLRLLAGPGADLGLFWASSKIGIGCPVRDLRHRPPG